jgi:serine/threonine protein kinase
MSDVAQNWATSGRFANVDGKDLIPRPNPALPGSVLRTVMGQAEAYYLTDSNGGSWILKRFLPGKRPDEQYILSIKDLIPARPGLECGYERSVLNPLSATAAGYHTPEFAAWIDTSVLMPMVSGLGWAEMADLLRDGTTTLTIEQRLWLCTDLSETVRRLESSGLSHRDLSSTNILVDLPGLKVNLIDWDSLYHKTLSMPTNTTWGTPGYIAPFVRVNGGDDPRVSWRPHSDRFSLAVLNVEFLSVDAGSPMTGDGGAFEQDELYARGGPKIDRLLDQVQLICPKASVLFQRCLRASNFDKCPSPAQWLAAVRSGNGVRAGILDTDARYPFVKFDESLLVRLNEDAFFKPPIG